MKDVTFTKKIKIVESIYDDHETLNPKLEKSLKDLKFLIQGSQTLKTK